MPNPVALSIQVLGPFAVTRDGMPVPAHELASRKGRTLLKLLLARRGGVVPAEALAEALWGDRPPADPDANLATLVSRLRAVLGPDVIAGGRDGWRFVAGPRLTVDLDDAERLLGEAVTAAGRAADPDLEARARLERGRVRLALGDYQAAFADQETALRLAREAGQDGLEAVALEQLGWTAYYARDSQAASELPMQPMELAERAAAARGAAPSALLLAARIRHAEGDLPGARDALDAVLGGQPEPATRRLGRPYLGLLLEHGDRFAEARRVLDEAVEECRAAGMFRPMLTACFAAALASGNLGDLAGALARLATMERLLAHVEDPLLHAQLALAECLLQAGGRLQRPFAYRRRVELRHAELASRLEPAAAERLLDLAGTYGSAKYRALALARLGRNREALQVAAPVGSDYLLAQIAGGPLARAALDRMAAALPPELRPAFTDRGRLAATLAGR